MKKFRIFLLVMTGAAVLMLGGCKEKAKYDESAFQDDLEPLTDDELEAMDENSDDEMIVEDDAELEQSQLKMKLPSIFMSMGMRRQTFLQKVTIMQTKCFR